MNKKIILKSSIALITASFLFSGCSVKSGAAYVNPEQNPESVRLCNIFDKPGGLCSIKEESILIFGLSNLSNYGFKNLSYTNAAAGALQAAAESTKLKGKTHFAIIYPDAISARNGVLMNTAEEFMDKCKLTVADILTFSGNSCNIFPDKQVPYAQMAIKIYDSEQVDIVTYNADDVIASLKKEGKYDAEGSVSVIIEANQAVLDKLSKSGK
jgi:hypothetical protein